MECSIVERIIPYSDVKQFKYLTMLIQEFHVKVDLLFINEIVEMVSTDLTDEESVSVELSYWVCYQKLINHFYLASEIRWRHSTPKRTTVCSRFDPFITRAKEFLRSIAFGSTKNPHFILNGRLRTRCATGSFINNFTRCWCHTNWHQWHRLQIVIFRTSIHILHSKTIDIRNCYPLCWSSCQTGLRFDIRIGCYWKSVRIGRRID